MDKAVEDTALSKDSDTLPIRELSRLTGVNAVTLRAWERRYGLLVPMRTAKGHRLYQQAHVERVREIQGWLGRGLAISKVKGLLDGDEATASPAVAGGLWEEYGGRMSLALEQLNRRHLDQLLGELTSLYPPALVVDQLLAPLLEQMRLAGHYGATTRRLLFETAVQEYFSSALYRQRQNARGPRLLMVSLSDRDTDLLPMILSYSLSVNDYRVEFIGPVPEAEWVFALQQFASRALVLYADSATGHADLSAQRCRWEEALRRPVFLAGRMTAVCTPERDTETRLLGQTHGEVMASIAYLERALNA